jgi:hypothetical protein
MANSRSNIYTIHLLLAYLKYCSLKVGGNQWRLLVTSGNPPPTHPNTILVKVGLTSEF